MENDIENKKCAFKKYGCTCSNMCARSSEYCLEHRFRPCKNCNGQATHECTFEGSYGVCGAPLCDKCMHYENEKLFHLHAEKYLLNSAFKKDKKNTDEIMILREKYFKQWDYMQARSNIELMEDMLQMLSYVDRLKDNLENRQRGVFSGGYSPIKEPLIIHGGVKPKPPKSE